MPVPKQHINSGYRCPPHYIYISRSPNIAGKLLNIVTVGMIPAGGLWIILTRTGESCTLIVYNC